MLEVVLDLRCLQLGPTRAVERSHLIVLWSRLGAYDPAELDRLLWEERRLFQYWAHAASLGRRRLGERVRAWMVANDEFRRELLADLERRGPLRVRDFEALAAVP